MFCSLLSYKFLFKTFFKFKLNSKFNLYVSDFNPSPTETKKLTLFTRIGLAMTYKIAYVVYHNRVNFDPVHVYVNNVTKSQESRLYWITAFHEITSLIAWLGSCWRSLQ